MEYLHEFTIASTPECAKMGEEKFPGEWTPKGPGRLPLGIIRPSLERASAGKHKGGRVYKRLWAISRNQRGKKGPVYPKFPFSGGISQKKKKKSNPSPAALPKGGPQPEKNKRAGKGLVAPSPPRLTGKTGLAKGTPKKFQV